MKDRNIKITYVDKKTDPNMPTYFIDFVHEANRVIQERKEKEKKVS